MKTTLLTVFLFVCLSSFAQTDNEYIGTDTVELYKQYDALYRQSIIVEGSTLATGITLTIINPATGLISMSITFSVVIIERIIYDRKLKKIEIEILKQR